MDNFKDEERTSSLYGETERWTQPRAELFIEEDKTLSRERSSSRRISETDTRKMSAKDEVDSHDPLEAVRSALLNSANTTLLTKTNRDPSSEIGNTATNGATQIGTGNENSVSLRKIATSIQEGFSSWVFRYLGNKSPVFIKSHVPVYRAVARKFAGSGNERQVSEWTISAGAKRHAEEMVENYRYDPHDPWTDHLKHDPEEYVAIKSTLGELERHGDIQIMHYGKYGSSRKKVIVHHADPNQHIKHKIIKSNKDT